MKSVFSLFRRFLLWGVATLSFSAFAQDAQFSSEGFLTISGAYTKYVKQELWDNYLKVESSLRCGENQTPIPKEFASKLLEFVTRSDVSVSMKDEPGSLRFAIEVFTLVERGLSSEMFLFIISPEDGAIQHVASVKSEIKGWSSNTVIEICSPTP